MIRTICAYCHATIAEEIATGDDQTSHGMCGACEAHFRPQWFEGVTLGEYLDRFGDPVLVVDGQGRVVAANRPMATLLGWPSRALAGLLGGDAMECQYARLPGGCGQTVHCKTCTIRRTVEATLGDGQPRLRVPTHFCHVDGPRSLLISTRRVGRTVEVTVEPGEAPEE